VFLKNLIQACDRCTAVEYILMFAIFIATSISAILNSKKNLKLKLGDPKLKPLTDPDLPGCYEAYVALNDALSVKDASGGGGRKHSRKVSTLAGEYAAFATQCPTTLSDPDCTAAYGAVEALEVDTQEILTAFVDDCKVEEPENGGDDDKKAGDIGHSTLIFNNLLLLLVMALAGNYFII
jgi:hypothetical protein